MKGVGIYKLSRESKATGVTRKRRIKRLAIEEAVDWGRWMDQGSRGWDCDEDDRISSARK